MKTGIVLLGCALLSSGCCRSGGVVPDQRVPHQLAADVTCAEVWANGPDGKLQRVKLRVPAGWWVASPGVVEGPP